MSSEYEDDDDTLSTQPPRGIASDRPPSQIEHKVCSISPRSPVDDLCAAIDAADWLLSRAKAIHQIVNQKAIEWIDRNGEFTIGEQVYSVGFNTTTRCTNTKQCGHQLLDSLQGDLDGLFSILVAQPYKPGSARNVLPEATYRNLFTVKRTSRLVAGVPDRVLRRGRLGFGR